MIIYGLKNCDTCRKALKQLPDFDLVDVRDPGVPLVTLSAAFDAFGDRLLNTRSTTWRGLDAEERKQPPLTLIKAYPALMKRPLIDRDGTLFLGWDKDTQAALGIT